MKANAKDMSLNEPFTLILETKEAISEYIDFVTENCAKEKNTLSSVENYSLNDACKDAAILWFKKNGEWPSMPGFLWYTASLLSMHNNTNAYFSIETMDKTYNYFARLAKITSSKKQDIPFEVNKIWNSIAQVIQREGPDGSKWKKQWVEEKHKGKNTYTNIQVYPNNICYRKHHHKTPKYVMPSNKEIMNKLENAEKFFQKAENILNSINEIIRYDLALNNYELAYKNSQCIHGSCGSFKNKYEIALNDFKEQYLKLYKQMLPRLLGNKDEIAALINRWNTEILNYIEDAENIDNVYGIPSFFEFIWLQTMRKREIKRLLEYQQKNKNDKKILLILAYYYGYKKQKEDAHKWFNRWVDERPVERIHCFVFALISGLEPDFNRSQIRVNDIEKYEGMFEQLYTNSNANLNGNEYEDCLYICHSDFYLIGRFYESKQEYDKAINAYKKGERFAPDYVGRDFYSALIRLYYNKFHDFKKALEYAKKMIEYYLKDSNNLNYDEAQEIGIKVYNILLMFNEFDLINELSEKLIGDSEKSEYYSSQIDYPYLMRAYLQFRKGNAAESKKSLNLFLSKPMGYMHDDAPKNKTKMKKSKMAGGNLDNFMSLAGYCDLDFLHFTISKVMLDIKYFDVLQNQHKFFASVAKKINICCCDKTFSFSVTNEEIKLIKEIFTYKEIFNVEQDSITIQKSLREEVFQLQLLLNYEYVSYLHKITSNDLAYNEFWSKTDQMPESEKCKIKCKKPIVNNLKLLKYGIQDHLTLNLQVEQAKTEKKIADAKLAERDQILSDLSHSIKNLLPSTIIDPLVRLQKQISSENTATIERALKGADLIGRLVESINNASSGCFEDFVYDANHKEEDALSLHDIVYNSIFFSIGNIFYARNSSKLRSKYFLENENIESNAKEALSNIEPSNFKQLSEFCNQYLFECNFKIKGLNKYILSDSKGSAMKMLIMFQEIIFNAVKYSRLVKRNKRFLNISIVPGTALFTVEITNSASSKFISKDTGLGQIIIEKMAGLMKAEYNVIKNDDSYCVRMEIPNFWKQKKAEIKQIKYVQESDREYSQASEKTGDYNA